MVNPGGIYIYCIIGEKGKESRGNNFKLGNIGIKNQRVYSIRYGDISAVVSDFSAEKLETSIDDLETHEKVVETTKQKIGMTVLPARFGTVVKDQEAVKNLLSKSHSEYKSKLSKLEGKDEIGIKVLKTKTFEEKVRGLVEAESQQIKSIKDKISSLPNDKKGSEHMLRLTLEDAFKKEIYEKVEQIALKIHQQFAEISENVYIKYR